MTDSQLTFDAGNYSDLAPTEEGQRLWFFLQEHDTLIRMEVATYLGRPALEAIQPQLQDVFSELIKEDRWKQMAGRMVRQVLDSRGYQLDQTGVRLKRNVLFKTASRYKKRS